MRTGRESEKERGLGRYENWKRKFFSYIYSLRGKATEERERRGKMTLNLTISVRNGDHDLIDGY